MKSINNFLFNFQFNFQCRFSFSLKLKPRFYLEFKRKEFWEEVDLIFRRLCLQYKIYDFLNYIYYGQDYKHYPTLFYTGNPITFKNGIKYIFWNLQNKTFNYDTKLWK